VGTVHSPSTIIARARSPHLLNLHSAHEPTSNNKNIYFFRTTLLALLSRHPICPPRLDQCSWSTAKQGKLSTWRLFPVQPLQGGGLPGSCRDKCSAPEGKTKQSSSGVPRVVKAGDRTETIFEYKLASPHRLAIKGELVELELELQASLLWITRSFMREPMGHRHRIFPARMYRGGFQKSAPNS